MYNYRKTVGFLASSRIGRVMMLGIVAMVAFSSLADAANQRRGVKVKSIVVESAASSAEAITAFTITGHEGTTTIYDTNQTVTLSVAVSIGDHYAGGIVFYVDQSGEHGLVAAERDLPDRGYSWDRARSECLRYEVNGYSDWYLPSIDELYELYIAYKFYRVIGGFKNGGYWSSSEYGADEAWFMRITGGTPEDTASKKYGYYSVRPVRAF